MLCPVSSRRFVPFSTGTNRQLLGPGPHWLGCDRYLRCDQKKRDVPSAGYTRPLAYCSVNAAEHNLPTHWETSDVY